MNGVGTWRMGILYTHGNVVLLTITSIHELIITKCSMCNFYINQTSDVLPKEMVLLATINIFLTPGIQTPYNKSWLSKKDSLDLTSNFPAQETPVSVGASYRSFLLPAETDM